MAFPVMWYLWWSVMLWEPRAPEERHPHNALGRPAYWVKR